MSDRLFYLYVTPFFPSKGRHYGSYSFDFVVELRRQSNYEVIVLVPGDGNDYTYRGVTVHTFKTRELPSSVLPLLFRCYNEQSFIKKVTGVLNSAVHHNHSSSVDILSNIKVCHANTVQFAIYSLAIKRLVPECKTLLHHHDLASCGLLLGRLRHNWLHKVIVWQQFRRLIEQMDLNIFISEASRRSLKAFPDTSWTVYGDYRKLGHGIGWMRSAILKRSYVMHNGVDTSLFNTEGRKSHDGFVIGCCANYWEMKDFPSLITALAGVRAQVPELKIRFMGKLGYYPLDRMLGRQINELGLNDILEFLPAVDHSQLSKFYQSLDLFVMPSYFEGFGCVYTEAYACGTPFIGCAGQGIEDLIVDEQKDLFLAKCHDAQDVQSKILTYYRERPVQRLNCDYTMSGIMKSFLGTIHE